VNTACAAKDKPLPKLNRDRHKYRFFLSGSRIVYGTLAECHRRNAANLGLQKCIELAAMSQSFSVQYLHMKFFSLITENKIHV
jgi:hypothetical protein